MDFASCQASGDFIVEMAIADSDRFWYNKEDLTRKELLNARKTEKGIAYSDIEQDLR